MKEEGGAIGNVEVCPKLEVKIPKDTATMHMKHDLVIPIALQVQIHPPAQRCAFRGHNILVKASRSYVPDWEPARPLIVGRWEVVAPHPSSAVSLIEP